jgi:hypothetical protein
MGSQYDFLWINLLRFHTDLRSIVDISQQHGTQALATIVQPAFDRADRNLQHIGNFRATEFVEIE